MQRKQLERLKGGGASSGGGNASAGGTSSEGASSGGVSSSGTLSAGQAGRSGGSHLTLDPASVEFAVSAVMSTTEMSGMILNSLVSSSSSSSLCTAQGDHMVARLSSSAASNGPSADGACLVFVLLVARLGCSLAEHFVSSGMAQRVIRLPHVREFDRILRASHLC